jgi:hypothetical protein
MKRLFLSVLMMLVCSGAALAGYRLVPGQYATIQAAVDASIAGDIVLIDEGTYDDCIHQVPLPDTSKAVVIMKSGVSLRGWGTGATIIEVRGRGRGIHCDGVVDATIEGITIRGAGSPVSVYGAGIYCYNGSSPTIRDCVLRENNDSGIIVRLNSHPDISNVSMLHNTGKEGGGLFVLTGCHPVVSSCLIDDNDAPVGGGVSVWNAAPQFLDCLIRRNHCFATGSGGGLVVLDASLTMTNCLVQDNFGGSGGGLSAESSTAAFSRCTFLGNRATRTEGPGGGLSLGFGTIATLEDCLIGRNRVEGTDSGADGGGVRAWGGSNSLTIRRCTIAANEAAGGLGGGVSIADCYPIIEQSIIASNGPGAGLYCAPEPLGGGAFTVSCSDLYGNAGGNLICGTDAGNNFYQNPLFCDLANNNFRLQGASPCLPGAHPGGPATCGGNLIGALGSGCAPLDVTGAEASLALETRPNPFRGSTEIRFDVPRSGRVGVVVYDAAGRELRNLAEGVMAAGPHAVAWDGADASGRRVPSGVYFYRLSIDGRTEGRRVIVAR